jgi:dihydroflavonol-4-reductase
MGKTLVTGGTGLIGSHIVRALVDRGDELRLLVRDPSRLAPLADLDLDAVTGEVGDREAVGRAMDGVSRVFHVAGITSMRPRYRELMFEVNVTGTRIVISAARRAGVERFVFTSSVAAIGPAERGGAGDETQPFSGAGLGVAYVDSKHEAEVDALRAAAEGLPLVCVNPTFVLGPDDPSPSGTSNALVRRFLLRQIPAYVDGGLNIVDVRDVARGHLLADERGEVGERYILGGRNFSLSRLFADLGRISGVEPPPIKLPGSVAVAGVGAAELARLPIPTSLDEVRSGSHWWTYRSTKAQRELGFVARPHEETLEDTVAWLRTRLGARVGRSQPLNLPLDVAGRALRIAGRLVGR